MRNTIGGLLVASLSVALFVNATIDMFATCSGCEASVKWMGGPAAGEGSWLTNKHENDGTCLSDGAGGCTADPECTATAVCDYTPPAGGNAGYAIGPFGAITWNTWTPGGGSISATLDVLECNKNESLHMYLMRADGTTKHIGFADVFCSKCVPDPE